MTLKTLSLNVYNCLHVVDDEFQINHGIVTSGHQIDMSFCKDIDFGKNSFSFDLKAGYFNSLEKCPHLYARCNLMGF